MSGPVSARQELARMQEGLMARLYGREGEVDDLTPAPDLSRTRRLLGARRRRLLEKAWPELEEMYGERWREEFSRYAMRRPPPPEPCPILELRAFLEDRRLRRRPGVRESLLEARVELTLGRRVVVRRGEGGLAIGLRWGRRQRVTWWGRIVFVLPPMGCAS